MYLFLEQSIKNKPFMIPEYDNLHCTPPENPKLSKKICGVCEGSGEIMGDFCYGCDGEGFFFDWPEPDFEE